VSLYERVATLPVEVESVELERLAIELPRFTRATTVVRLHGGGETGVGEDVTYDSAAHDDPPAPAIEGRWDSLDELSRALDGAQLFRDEPGQAAFRDYRRWAWDSAALDLALRQAGMSLADALGRTPRPVRFVISPRISQPPSAEPVPGWLAVEPGVRFKLDPTPDWSGELVAELAATGAVDVVDLKGQYRGTVVDNPPDARLYRLVAEAFPDAWIEDPALDDVEAADALAPYRERITWDAPIHSVADIEALAFEPRMLNVKPSRFGTVRRLLDTFDHCTARGITTYGGGQFELGPGRGQIQYIASLFSPDAPNDVAPGAYNEGGPRAGLPSTPLGPAASPVGFAWG
jgi:L-alanine-DL-glutamate epimerase-like enolase superfamily enzyme